jgi:hypothetical protein
LHSLPATNPETPALSRGLGRGAQPNPNRRRRVPGRLRAAGRVYLCCQVWRFGFASDSPHREYWRFEFHSLRHPVCVSGDDRTRGASQQGISRRFAGFWPGAPSDPEPETAGGAPGRVITADYLRDQFRRFARRSGPRADLSISGHVPVAQVRVEPHTCGGRAGKGGAKKSKVFAGRSLLAGRKARAAPGIGWLDSD